MDKQIKYILTDIEGTTSSVHFVYEVLFPYFREHLNDLTKHAQVNEVKQAFAEVIEITLQEEGKHLTTTEEVLACLEKWSREDRKLTPLKTLQGVIWKNGYETGAITGHVYEDVPTALNQWRALGLKIGVFSSGSIAAQKLLFRFSDFGDLSGHFSNHFDTTTGSKKDNETYLKITQFLGLAADQILFLSDIVAELEAAQKAGLQTIQLVRDGAAVGWSHTVQHFLEI
ncbi:MAG: acireductone synthase [Bacteroidota bacterium]